MYRPIQKGGSIAVHPRTTTKVIMANRQPATPAPGYSLHLRRRYRRLVKSFKSFKAHHPKLYDVFEGTWFFLLIFGTPSFSTLIVNWICGSGP
jgi:hypothetical protein